MKTFKKNFARTLIFSAAIFFLVLPAGATTIVTNADNSISSPPIQIGTAREFYNAGTKKLHAGKLEDAESLLESSLQKQDERVQPAALFNLGHVRFAEGIVELKKSPDGAANQGQAATEDGTGAIPKATDALASDDVEQMVNAYLAGRGARREMRAAMKAVQQAMEAHGKTLAKWRRALGDFQSAAELNPADTNAAQNAQIVERAIAKLVDSLRELQQVATNLGDKQKQLGELLKKLKGKIPAPSMPPGAAGGKDDDDEGEDGKKPSPESLAGQKESDKGGGGQEMELKISSEQAGQLMDGLLPGAKQLPMAQGQPGQPANGSGRIW